MSVSRPSRRNPEARAAEILDAYHRSRTLPIPVDRIAADLGAEVCAIVLDPDLSGMLVRKGELRIISVQRDHGDTRKRFTIAHELGHLLLHPGRPFIAETDRPVRVDLRINTPGYANVREEREANQFAAALLMPLEVVQARWDALSARNLEPVDVAAKMAKEFQVSTVAMKYRIVNLAIYPDLEALLAQ